MQMSSWKYCAEECISLHCLLWQRMMAAFISIQTVIVCMSSNYTGIYWTLKALVHHH